MTTFRTPRANPRLEGFRCAVAPGPRPFAALGVLLCCEASAAAAHADPAPVASLTSLGRIPPGRLIGGSPSAGYSSAAPSGGPLLAVEGAWATTLPAGDEAAQGGWAFGARAGWALPNGLSAHARYDDLGVEPSGLQIPLQLATAGLRYAFPFFVPLPFAEVDAGPAFAGGDVRFGAGAALGASVPIGRQVLVDVVAHDWLVPVGASLRQIVTVGLGLAVTFASPAR